MNTITVKFGSVGLLIWAGLGVLYHLMTSDIPFTWADPWLYVTMAIWPLFIFGWIVTVIAVIFVMYAIYDSYTTAARRRRWEKTPKGQKMKENRRKIAEQRKAQQERKASLPKDRR
jgi:membrane protein implicated in regulation of membrane protease activity